jgi:hypothetical protein
MRLLLLEITPALPQLVSIPPPLNGSRPASIFSPATWHIRLKWPLMCAQLHALSFSRFNIDYNYFCSCKTSIHPVPTSTSPAWTVLVYALPYPLCTPIFCALPA